MCKQIKGSRQIFFLYITISYVLMHIHAKHVLMHIHAKHVLMHIHTKHEGTGA